MPRLAINIDLTDRNVLIAGGGEVALRKALTLCESGAAVLVVAPEIHPRIVELSVSGNVSIHERCYRPDDLEGVFLAIAATGDRDVNQKVAEDARQCGILVTVVDNPESGNCIFPAILKRGNLEIAVSTGGRCPVLAREVRDIIADVITEDFSGIAEQLALEREKLLTEGNCSSYNSQVLRARARSLIAELSRYKDIP